MLSSLLCLVSFVHAAEPTSLVLVTTPVKRVEGIETFTMRAPKLTATEWIVMTAKAPELPCQTKVNTSLLPVGGKPTVDLSPLKRPLIQLHLPVKGGRLQKEITVKVKHQATLMARKLVPRASVPAAKLKGLPKAPVLTAAERKGFLRSDSIEDHESRPFQEWLDKNTLRREKAEGDVDFAQRVYNHIRKHIKYKFTPGQDRHSSRVCKDGETDCGGQSALFVSVLRANQIPARSLIGRWATSATKGENPLQYHVIAEFFAEGMGWVPVDPSGGRFADDPGDFLVFHVDFDLVYNSKTFGRQTVLLSQLPAILAAGSGSFDGSSDDDDWEVKELPR